MSLNKEPVASKYVAAPGIDATAWNRFSWPSVYVWTVTGKWPHAEHSREQSWWWNPHPKTLLQWAALPGTCSDLACLLLGVVTQYCVSPLDLCTLMYSPSGFLCQSCLLGENDTVLRNRAPMPPWQLLHDISHCRILHGALPQDG